MGRGLFVVALAILGGVGSGARAYGGDPPPEPPMATDVAAQVEAWLKDLTSESYDVREAVRKGSQ